MVGPELARNDEVSVWHPCFYCAMNRGTQALVRSRRQTPIIRRWTVHTGAPNVQDLRTRFEALRKYFYANLVKLKTGELANFDELHERFSKFDQTNTDAANPELYTFEQKLQFWEERRTAIEQLPSDYQETKPGVYVSPETAQSMFGLGAGIGAGSAFAICALMALAKRAGRNKRAA
jgi:hypothetical protein